MKHLKTYQQLNESIEEIKIEDILSKLGVKDWKIEDDHLGNKNVYLFKHKGFDFEVYSLEDIEVDSVKGEPYHVNYGQKGKWIDNFNTMDLKKSLSEIFEKIDNGLGDKYVG
jgi:hypothetical protein